MSWRGPWKIEALGTEWTYGWFDIGVVILIAGLIALYAIVGSVR
jgi:hypothetical protein